MEASQVMTIMVEAMVVDRTGVALEEEAMGITVS